MDMNEIENRFLYIGKQPLTESHRLLNNLYRDIPVTPEFEEILHRIKSCATVADKLMSELGKVEDVIGQNLYRN